MLRTAVTESSLPISGIDSLPDPGLGIGFTIVAAARICELSGTPLGAGGVIAAETLFAAAVSDESEAAIVESIAPGERPLALVA
jgi:hypothetical protein